MPPAELSFVGLAPLGYLSTIDTVRSSPVSVWIVNGIDNLFAICHQQSHQLSFTAKCPVRADVAIEPQKQNMSFDVEETVCSNLSQQPGATAEKESNTPLACNY